jgi:hypothetical protein
MGKYDEDATKRRLNDLGNNWTPGSHTSTQEGRMRQQQWDAAHPPPKPSPSYPPPVSQSNSPSPVSYPIPVTSQSLPVTAQPYRTGLGEKTGNGLFNFGKWFIDHLWPLSASVRLGQRLTKVGWKVRLTLAILGAFLSPALIVNNHGKPPVWPWAQVMLTDLAGHYAILVAVGLGVAAGWALPKTAGLVIILAAWLTGLGIGLGLIALAVVIAYKVIDAIAERSSKDGTSRPEHIEQPARR